ncbi:MAG: glycosyl hydrolase [Tannerellaceae bacterium]|jgi:hypothetical protein|nr:glycosyl hydrolase [Tannerellaceae bacterium]
MMQLFNKSLIFPIFISVLAGCMSPNGQNSALRALAKEFVSPPDAARPGVYWYFMDGNLSKDGITSDLVSMKEAGIGNVLFLEVNVGVPRGNVNFMSEEWQSLFAHAVSEAKRLGIELTMGSGPGWAGSGAPWVKPEQSMRNLVASDTTVKGPSMFDAVPAIPSLPRQRHNFWPLTEKLSALRDAYYEDVCVLAFPTPDNDERIADIGEKALYWRAPYSSMNGVKAFIPSGIDCPVGSSGIDRSKIIDLTDKIDDSGRLKWEIPEGRWTIMRFGMRNNGVVSRPAPEPGLGFEVDKFDAGHLNSFFEDYYSNLLRITGKTGNVEKSGWTMLHIDSWEMSSQNWSDNFRDEFTKRRGYDPLKCLPVYTGRVVENVEVSERFLWDVRQTAMELVVENYGARFRKLGEKYGFKLSIQPYDMNPASDFDLGAAADVPGCEFWTEGQGYNCVYACTEATSVAHIYGRPVVEAESFTAQGNSWEMYPGNVKNQGDWAFCTGINKFVYHTFAHHSFDDKYVPGMTMGSYGVHWDRGQTWWTMSTAYHRYITRCSHLLRQGRAVADILYLNIEGAPHVFTPPQSAFTSLPAESDAQEWNFRHQAFLPDRRGYNFDACSPAALMESASVDERGNIIFPSGATYRILVLPNAATMTPRLLATIEKLVKSGATIIGNPPVKSPSLTGYPECDKSVKETAEQMWGSLQSSSVEKIISCGSGHILFGGKYAQYKEGEIYPDYEVVAEHLRNTGEKEDFASATGNIRYTHRALGTADIYFISNRTDRAVEDVCTFRSSGVPELWDAVTGEMRTLSGYKETDGAISLPVRLSPSQSFFIVFDKTGAQSTKESLPDFLVQTEIQTIGGSWEVSFDTSLGGPEKATFESLTDWSKHTDEGIRYYSGKAVYRKVFDLSEKKGTLFLDLGKVKNIARVRLNGHDLGVVWTSPFQVNITKSVKEKENILEIEVANLWVNRFIGDDYLPDDGVKDGKWPEWLLNGTERTSGRITFAPRRFYTRESPLMESGLLGDVRIVRE